MAMQQHLADLEQRHRALEDEITEALAHPSTDRLKIAELKLLTHGIINDTAEASCIGRNLVNTQLVVVFCRELSTKLTGSLAARER